MPQTLNPYIYCLNNPLALVDLDGRFPTREEVEEIINDITAKYNRTLTYGVDLSGTLGIFSVDGSIGISIDCKGNIAFQSTGTWDVMASSSPSAAVSIFRTKTNASCIDDLNEYGGCIGASVGVPIYGVPVCFGGDFIIVGDLGNKISDGGNYYGYSLAIGVGVPGIEAHAGQSYTKTEGSSINIIEIFLD